MTYRTGQLLRLKRDVIAIDTGGDKSTAITVPAGAIMCANGERNPDNTQMIEVEWQDYRLFMFAVDVEERAEKINGRE
jgi:hypothetical protein